MLNGDKLRSQAPTQNVIRWDQATLHLAHGHGFEQEQCGLFCAGCDYPINRPEATVIFSTI